MLDRRSLSFALAATVGAEIAAAQVTVEAHVMQPLTVHAAYQGLPSQTQNVPVGTELTSLGPVTALSQLNPVQKSRLTYSATATTSPIGTTCELRCEGTFLSGSSSVLGLLESSGSVLVSFTSAVPVAGVVVAESHLDPSGGWAMSTVSVMNADFADDASVELSLTSPLWHDHGVACTLQPGQPFVVRVDHAMQVTGDTIGEHDQSITLRFVPHADFLLPYGPACTPTLVRHLLDGSSYVFLAPTNPAPDFHLLAVGLSTAVIPLTAPTNCPLLNSADLILGPYAPAPVVLPPALLPPGFALYLQIFGVDVPTNTFNGSSGVLLLGQ